MNLSSIIPLFMLGAAATGALIGPSYGYPWLQGALVGFGLGWVPLLLLGLAAGLIQLWRPDLPRCRAGSCAYPDYEFLEHRPSKSEDGIEFLYRCQCGGRYLLREGRLCELAEDGSERPFMLVSRWGRWIDADSA
jgi:hypothetical protein